MLEIGAEEIPASYLPSVLAYVKTFAEENLRLRKLPFEKISSYGTPRRIALLVCGVPSRSEPTTEEVLGPSLKAAKDPSNAWTQAARGFAESQGIGVDELQVRQTKKGEYVCSVKKHSGIRAEKIFTELFTELAPSIPFPKRMVWNASRFKFARPIRNIVALYGSQCLRMAIAGVKSCNKTFTLSHASAKKISIGSPQNYLTGLKNHCILADPQVRRETIINSASQLALKAGGQVRLDEELLEEIVWLVEHPVAILGTFDTQFLSLPQEVLVTCMKKHQKFFSVLDPKGKILPCFVAIRNGISEHQDIVRKGYEKVLNARLTDAKFFSETDLKRPLDAYVQKCSGISLQEKLGSMSDKIGRMKHIVDFLIKEVPLPEGCIDANAAQRAVHLSKFDLATNMVYEFPELQGVIGGIYAMYYGESRKVADAVREHYYPVAVQGELPGSPESSVVSIADKTDGLVGSFLTGRLPSGSSDPYGLRRQSMGILRILLKNNWDLSVQKLVQFTVGQFDVSNASPAPAGRETASKEILNFFADRLQLLMQDLNYEQDEVQAVIKNLNHNDAHDLKVVSLKEKIAALSAVRKHPDFDAVATAFKRTANILKQAKTKQMPHSPDMFNPAFLKEEEEINLYNVLTQITEKTQALIKEKKYKETLQEWVTLRLILDRFFEKVMVMDPDGVLCTNRLSLLSKLELLFKEIAEFSYLQNKVRP